MLIGSINVGRRSAANVVDEPKRWSTYGISMAGSVVVRDFGKTEQDIPITFNVMTEATKNSLKAYLMYSVKPYNSVTVTPDAGDDLQIGVSGAVSLIFVEWTSATYVSKNYWKVELLFKYISSS